MPRINAVLRIGGPHRSAGPVARWQATPWLLAFWGCTEGISPVGLDFSKHDRCTGAPPQDVDASASEIQCQVDYTFQINNDLYIRR